MKFQYISDIHLEHGTKVNIIPEAPYLILAGDIGYPFKDHYVEFLQDVTSKFEKVFLVLGNHEYWGNSFASVRRRMGELAGRFKNLIFLDNSVHDLTDGLSIYGTTLWTHVKDIEYIKQNMWDYKHIPSFAPEHSNNLHKIARKTFTAYQQRYPPSHKWIVITHHMPHTCLIAEKYKDNPLNEAYATDVEEFTDPNVLAVVFGHTHTPISTLKYFCNPYGYPDENPNPEVNKTFDVDI